MNGYLFGRTGWFTGVPILGHNDLSMSKSYNYNSFNNLPIGMLGTAALLNHYWWCLNSGCQVIIHLATFFCCHCSLTATQLLMLLINGMIVS